ncbi:hypothetical protein SAMN05421858_3074 [Haladaptatus litoreus]|uniref:Uncharacterized protein n=1 Tax=Haladaptatus litoreus TaxID=553468 RepID=A0A1N7CKN7_9EURY|nr:hypothetical protein [Haladaptatus litoreus]SIR64162.1 hypothetical protein SAMN05421858_3074 [Haladaptatus litoreus]
MTTNTQTVVKTVERGLRCAIGFVFVVGLRRRNPGAVVNAAIALAATSLPDIIERRYDVTFRPWQRLYSNTAMLTHSVGMLGPYDDVWWWDHLTHTHSSTLLSGLVYAASRREGRNPCPRVLATIVGIGSLWELMEYIIHAVANRFGFEPILVSYGKSDVIRDFVFNLLGAVLVLVFGDELLRNLYERVDYAER